MALTYRTIGFPDNLLKVQEGTFDLEFRAITSDTVFTPFIQAVGPMAALWGCQLTLVAQSREGSTDKAGWQQWQSFRARLGGQVVLFNLRSPGMELPLGVGAGYDSDNPEYAISGLTLTGAVILTGGTTAVVTQAAPRYAEAIKIDFGTAQASSIVLKHGDRFGLGGNLYMCVADVTADASGVARVPFRWKLWKPAKVGDIVTMRRPTCRVMLRAPNDSKVQFDAAMHGRLGFSAIEIPYID